MSKNGIQSSLKNINFDELTAEQIIKKYEEVLFSRENQVFELSSEVGQVNQKLETLKAKHQNCKEKNNQLHNIYKKKDLLLKQELENKEIMFMQLAKKEKECDEFQEKINEFKKNKNNTKDKKEKNNEKNNEKKKEEKKIEENKNEIEKNDDKKKDNSVESDPKLLAREKINKLTNKGEGMKKINFAELLKKNQEKKNENNEQ